MSKWFETYGFARIVPGLYSGAIPLDAADVEALSAEGITRVLNLVEHREYEPGTRQLIEAVYAELQIEECRLQTRDFGGLAAQYLEHAVAIVNPWLDAGQVVYVHCRAGWQRSATVVAAVIAVRQDLDPNQAIARVTQAKPTANPLPHQREDLISWWNDRAAS